MKITSLVENTSNCGLATEHGLSLYVELTEGERILFDMGQGKLFTENAESLGVRLSDVDFAIISHGHYDHGGGLRTFLNVNTHAPVYINHLAFEAHYSLRETGLRYIGLDQELASHPRVRLCKTTEAFSSKIMLFSHVSGTAYKPHGNRLLYGADKRSTDTFAHEQNLLIEEGDKRILIAGCAHAGILNIMKRAEELIGTPPTHVVSGMHLVKSGLSETDEDVFIKDLATSLLSINGCQYYTMHCTGTEQYLKLKQTMNDRINYLSCGETVII